MTLTLILTEEGLKAKPRKLFMDREGEIHLAVAEMAPTIHTITEWVPNLHPRWPKGTEQGGENVGGQFMHKFDTEDIKAMLGPELENNGPSDIKLDLGWWVQGSNHIKELQLFRAKGQTGDKIVARMRLDTVIPKTPAPVIQVSSDSTKIGSLPVGTQFKDAFDKEWEVVSGEGESYVTVKPIGDNKYDHPTTRLIGKADAFVETPVEAPAPVEEVDDGEPPEPFSNYSAFVTDYSTFTIEKLASLLESVDKTQPIEQQSHGYKISPVEGNYHKFVAAHKGEKANVSSASTGQATVFARPTTSNTPDQTPHDSSIEIHHLSGMTEAQWEEFGGEDQKLYNKLMDKFGAWTEKKGSSLISSNKQKASSVATQAYNDAISNQGGSGKKATDLGFLFDVSEGYNVYASNYPEKVKDKYLEAEALLLEVQDIAAWDLFNRTKDPNIILWHHNDTDVQTTKTLAEEGQLAVGQYPYYGGLSWSTNLNLSSFGSGGSTIGAQMPISRISLFNLIQSLYTHNEAEYVIRQEIFFDTDHTIFFHNGANQFEGGPEAYAKLNALSTTENPKPGSWWENIKSWYKGFLDPPKPLSHMKPGQFFRTTDDDIVWNIKMSDSDGVLAQKYLDTHGEKVEGVETKVFGLDEEHPPVLPRLDAHQLGVGEVIEDDQGNKWQNVGLTDGSGNFLLVPYDVTDGLDPHNALYGPYDSVKVFSLKEDLPDWLDTYNDHDIEKLGNQLEGAIIMTAYGQRLQVLSPGKHGENAKLIGVDEDGNQLSDTQMTKSTGEQISVLKPGHPPLPPPQIGEIVELSRLKAGDVFESDDAEIKIQHVSADGFSAVWTHNTAVHLKGEKANDYFTPGSKVKLLRHEDPPVLDPSQSGAQSVYVDDLDPGDTFFWNKAYWKFEKLDGDYVHAYQPNPKSEKIEKQIETYQKVFPSGIPSQPYSQTEAILGDGSFDNVEIGDETKIGATIYSITKKSNDSITFQSTLNSAYVHTLSKNEFDGHNPRKVTPPVLDPRPKVGESISAKTLWINDVVETADGTKVKVAKAPKHYDQPFVNFETNEFEFYDGGAYYTYLGTADDLKAEVPTSKPVSPPPGLSYNTDLKDTKPGYIIQTTNGSRWRVIQNGFGVTDLGGIDSDGKDLPHVDAAVVHDAGDPVAVIDSGRKTLMDLVPGDTFQYDSPYDKRVFAIIQNMDDGSIKTHPLTNNNGDPYITTKPDFVHESGDMEVLYKGKSIPHPEMAPQEKLTAGDAGFAKKSTQIGEVELWNPGSLVVSGNYFYVVGPSSHGETMLTDMAGHQHFVPSKKFLVKSASNGPKPVKGLKLVPTNEFYKEPPKKGEYFYLGGHYYVMITPQIKSAKVVEVDEYGSTIGEMKKLAVLGSGNQTAIAARGVLKIHPEKADSPLPKSYVSDFDPAEVKQTDGKGIAPGDYVYDQLTQSYMMVGGKPPNTEEIHLVKLDKAGNSTGTFVIRPTRDDYYTLVETPTGGVRATAFDSGDLIVLPDGDMGMISEKTNYSMKVTKENGDTTSLAAKDIVKKYNGPVPKKVVGKPIASWLLEVGDIVNIKKPGYGNDDINATVTSNYWPLITYDDPNDTTYHKAWKYNHSWQSMPVTLVSEVEKQEAPQEENKIKVVPDKTEPIIAPMPKLPTIGNMKVDQSFQIKAFDGSYFRWKVIGMDMSTIHLEKIGDNPNQNELADVIIGGESSKTKVEIISDPIPDPVVPIPDVEPSFFKEGFEANSPDDWIVGDASNLKVGDFFYAMDQASATGLVGKTSNIPYVQDGRMFEIESDNGYGVFQIKSVKNGAKWSWGYAWPVSVPPKVEESSKPTPIEAKAFTEAVEARQKSGVPRMEAISQTASAMSKTMDQAIDSYPAAELPPAGSLVPLKELQIGDTYKILPSNGNTKAGWQWKLTGKTDDGSILLEAVDKKPAQPEKFVSSNISTSSIQVEKVASDNPSATLDPKDLEAGDVFQVKVHTGEIYTWKVISLDGDNIHLQAVGSTKGSNQQKNFKTTVTNVTKQFKAGSWLPL